MKHALRDPDAAGAVGLALRYGQKDSRGEGGDDVLAEIKSIGAQVKKRHDEFQEEVEKLKTDFNNGTKEHEQFKSDLDEKLSEHTKSLDKLSELFTEFEQKLARAKGQTEDSLKSIGYQVAESDGFKGIDSTFRGKKSFEVKGRIGQKDITSLPASAGPMVDPQRLPGVVTAPNRRMTVRGLLAKGRTNSNAVEYVRELLFTNNAAPQTAEGAAKAKSELTYELQSAPVRTIAHHIRASKQILDDAPGLASQIDNRLVYGYNYKEELQLLTGAGTGQNLKGLVTAATAYSDPTSGAVVSPTRIDILRLAMLQATVAEYFADGIVLNPIDWALIELTKDTQGRYIIGQPQGQIGATLWNTPVAPTNAMTADAFLVGAMSQAAQIFDRDEVNVTVSSEDGNNFTENMVTVLCEGRLAFPIFREDALVTGDLTPE